MNDIKIEIRREGGLVNAFDDGKFSEKMTHAQRCFAICLYIKGEPWRRIAAYFNTHYRTIQMIKSGPRYKAVRNEFQQLGQDEFVSKYATEIALGEYNKWKKDHDEEFGADRQHVDPNKPGWSPIKNATGSKGQHERKSVLDGNPVFFDVEWRDTNDAKKPGWYMFHRDGELGPFGTSAMAFDAAKELWNPTPKPVEPTVDAEGLEAQRLFENAKHARAEMEANPSEQTVCAFVSAAFEVYKFVDKSEGLPQASHQDMFHRIDWRGFDHKPYAELRGYYL